MVEDEENEENKGKEYEMVNEREEDEMAEDEGTFALLVSSARTGPAAPCSPVCLPSADTQPSEGHPCQRRARGEEANLCWHNLKKSGIIDEC